MKKISLAFLPLLYILFFTTGICGQKRTLYHRIKTNITARELDNLRKKGVDLVHFEDTGIGLVAELPEEQIELIKLNGFNVEYLLYDLESNYAAVNRITDSIYRASLQNNTGIQNRLSSVSTPVNFQLGSMGGFPTYAEINDALDSMKSKYPALVAAKISIGNSLEGRPIYMIRVSDNAETDENESELLLTSLHHANEPMGVSATLFFIWHLLENYETNKEFKTLLNNTEIYFVPCVNPDGYVYNETNFPAGGGMQRKNRRQNCATDVNKGVDLNRNYGYKWGINTAGSSSNPCHNRYARGTAAWSEPETQAMRNFVTAKSFVLANNYHAFGDFYMYPWAYVDSLPDGQDSILFKEMGAYCVEGISNFKHGNFKRTLNYLANGECADWLYGDETAKPKIYAVTIEIGKSADGGFWPASSNIVPLCNRIIDMNIKSLRMTPEYAKITDSTQAAFYSLSNHIRYSLQRFSIRPASFTVSVTPLSSWVISVASNKVYNALSFLENRLDSIAFTLHPSTPGGTSLQFVVETNNGAWSVYDTITRIYNSPVVLPIRCENDYEPDNSIYSARNISDGDRIYSRISVPGDEDWYQIQLRQDENLQVILKDMPADYDISVFDATLKEAGVSQNYGLAADTVVLNHALPGIYYILIKGFNRAHNFTHCYELVPAVSDRLITIPFSGGLKKILPAPGKMTVYPGLAHHQITILFDSKISSSIEILMHDISGRLLKNTSHIAVKGRNIYKADIAALTPGIYAVSILQEGYLQTKKIIKVVQK